MLKIYRELCTINTVAPNDENFLEFTKQIL
jgi:hypothetical protein